MAHLLVSTDHEGNRLARYMHKIGITLMFSQTNPLYADDTQRLWRKIMETCLDICIPSLNTNEQLAATLLDLDVHLRNI